MDVFLIEIDGARQGVFQLNVVPIVCAEPLNVPIDFALLIGTKGVISISICPATILLALFKLALDKFLVYALCVNCYVKPH